jgi:hypothetical protein
VTLALDFPSFSLVGLHSLSFNHCLGYQLCFFDEAYQRGRKLHRYSLDHELALIAEDWKELSISHPKRSPSVHRFSSSQEISCDQRRASEWRNKIMITEASKQSREFKSLVSKNSRAFWVEYASEALKLAADACASLDIPVILGPYATLGWYQQCTPPIQGTVLDLLVPVDSFLSSDHLRLLQAWFFGLCSSYLVESAQCSSHYGPDRLSRGLPAAVRHYHDLCI